MTWTIRDPDEIIRAHDILAAVLLGEAPITVSERVRAQASAALPVLCWVLHHDDTLAFAGALAAIEAARRRADGD